jgi:uncharacterized protein YdaU (DUF1376 family)
MSDQLPFLKVFTKDYFGETRNLSYAERGIHTILTYEYWDRDGYFPAEGSFVYGICQCRSKKDKVLVDTVLAGFFRLEGDFFKHDGLDRLRNSAKTVRYRNVQNIQKRYTKPLPNGYQNSTRRVPNSYQTATKILPGDYENDT